MGIFNQHMPTPNQINKITNAEVSVKDLLEPAKGDVTEAGLRSNVRVSILYLEAWLRGSGCVPIDNLMEDAATMEIGRTQVWQWIRHGTKLNDGRVITRDFVANIIREEAAKLKKAVGDAKYNGGKYAGAVSLTEKLCLDNEYYDFSTSEAYPSVLSTTQSKL
eukprot:GFYU01000273.1.p2 GENE.GFYU01000273.1~~GFYU01000273.1.p2  ORF type:complete len:174 (-),score=52.80 GFYU01000273.1:116-604(-)